MFSSTFLGSFSFPINLEIATPTLFWFFLSHLNHKTYSFPILENKISKPSLCNFQVFWHSSSGDSKCLVKLSCTCCLLHDAEIFVNNFHHLLIISSGDDFYWTDSQPLSIIMVNLKLIVYNLKLYNRGLAINGYRLSGPGYHKGVPP